MQRLSLASSLIQKFDKNLRERILGANVSKEALNKFREKQKQDSVKQLTDLLDLRSKSESEVYEVLNTMVKNSQFFMYCGPLLLNINPGPNNIKDYLNLQSWIKETEKSEEKDWKPHLYTFMNNIKSFNLAIFWTYHATKIFYYMNHIKSFPATYLS